MKFLTFLSLFLLSLLWSTRYFASAPAAAPYPRAEYTTTYENVEPSGTFDGGTYSSDGNGHILVSHAILIRLEDYINSNVNQQNSPYLNVDTVPITASNAMLDGLYMNEGLYVWFQSRRKQKWSLLDHWWAALWGDKLSKLGERLVDGHNCRGYLQTSNYYPINSRQERWFDKDLGYLVREERSDGGRAVTIRLKSFSNVALPPQAFVLPIRDPKLWAQVTGRVARDPNAEKQTGESLRHVRKQVFKLQANPESAPQSRDQSLHMQPMLPKNSPNTD
jgi:hypothetical protein